MQKWSKFIIVGVIFILISLTSFFMIKDNFKSASDQPSLTKTTQYKGQSYFQPHVGYIPAGKVYCVSSSLTRYYIEDAIRDISLIAGIAFLIMGIFPLVDEMEKKKVQ